MGSSTIAGARRAVEGIDPVLLLRVSRVLPVALLGSVTLAGCEGETLPPAPRDPATLAIGAVQGSGARSPLEGREVVVEGVVTRNLAADPERSGLVFSEAVAGEPDGTRDGWFIQDGGDGDPATADALYVPNRAHTVLSLPADAAYTMRIGSSLRSGDRVAVRGRVFEHPAPAGEDRGAGGIRISFGEPGGTLTAVEAAEERPLPLELASIVPGAASEEASEGMRITPPSHGP
ncbi:hypothetical protein ACQQ2N_00960 [Dokdonella sp. MW10]|uniref:hypothetical protein n=1 Tax=Dokdonella sp. MW10 TaxID=2992926 RepID=UPI003F7CF533